MSSSEPSSPPTPAELVELVEQLDADNERLRMKALELGELVEDAVTAQVAAERRASELEVRLQALEAELSTLSNSRVVRAARPFRSAFGRLRARRGASHG